RPQNAFFLYRSERRADIIAKHGVVRNQDVSRVAGQLWKNEPEHVRSQYVAMARANYQEHFERNPDFVWMP
ncbi:high mobility group box domain-containing protein, partial [Entophlyctis helioformis]